MRALIKQALRSRRPRANTRARPVLPPASSLEARALLQLRRVDASARQDQRMNASYTLRNAKATAEKLPYPLPPGSFVQLYDRYFVSWAGSLDLNLLFRSLAIRGKPLGLFDASQVWPNHHIEGGETPGDLTSAVRFNREYPYLAFSPIPSAGRTATFDWIWDFYNVLDIEPVPVHGSPSLFTAPAETGRLLLRFRDSLMEPALRILYNCSHPERGRFEEWSRQDLVVQGPTPRAVLDQLHDHRRQFLEIIAAVTFAWARDPERFVPLLSEQEQRILWEVGVGDWRMHRRGAVVNLLLVDEGLDVEDYLNIMARHRVPAVYDWVDEFKLRPALRIFDPSARGFANQGLSDRETVESFFTPVKTLASSPPPKRPKIIFDGWSAKSVEYESLRTSPSVLDTTEPPVGWDRILWRARLECDSTTDEYLCWRALTDPHLSTYELLREAALVGFPFRLNYAELDVPAFRDSSIKLGGPRPLYLKEGNRRFQAPLHAPAGGYEAYVAWKTEFVAALTT
jgi:hypothetical protein